MTRALQRHMTVRSHLLHILSFAEGGYRSHQTGTFDIDDMMAATASTAALESFSRYLRLR